MRQELIDAMIGIGEKEGWIPPLPLTEQYPRPSDCTKEEHSCFRDPTMPQFRLDADQLADVIAYLETLQN